MVWKSKIFQNFFSKCKLRIVLNLFLVNIILILQNYLFWSYLKWRKIRVLEAWTNRSVIKFLLAEKCKQCEICIKIRDVYREAGISQNMFTNRLNMSLRLQVWIEKTVMKRKYTDFQVKKKFWEQQSGKKVILTVFWGLEGHITINFHEKKSTVYSFLLPSYIYIYI